MLIVTLASRDWSRTFSIFYVLFSVVIIAMALGNIGAIKLAMRQEKKKFDMLHRKLDLSSIIAMDDDGDGVDRIEFLTAMLMQMNGLSKEDDIDPWLKVRQAGRRQDRLHHLAMTAS